VFTSGASLADPASERKQDEADRQRRGVSYGSPLPTNTATKSIRTPQLKKSAESAHSAESLGRHLLDLELNSPDKKRSKALDDCAIVSEQTGGAQQGTPYTVKGDHTMKRKRGTGGAAADSLLRMSV
jgi:hypothetical protein